METVPAVLDVRDDLHAVRETADEDVTDRVDEVLADLEAYAERDVADREGLLESVENRLLAVEERLDGAAAEHARAARNRVHSYREAVTRTAVPLAVLDTGFREVADGTVPSGDAVLSATVVHDADEPRRGVPVVGFYAPDGTELAECVGPAVEFAPGDQRTVELPVAVPTDTAYYTVAVVDEGQVG